MYPGPDTAFQMEPGRCEGVYRHGDFRETGSWFRKQYWERGLEGLRTEAVRWKVGDLQVAVHVRRGDFSIYNRTMVADAAYADVVAATKGVADGLWGTDVRMNVAVFSEGIAEGKVKDMHDVKKMRGLYQTEKGEAIEQPTRHWQRLVDKRVSGVKVKAYVATDTLEAVHSMAQADVFVGSRSGMSVHLVGVLARGVVLIPAEKGAGPEEKGWVLKFQHTSKRGRVVKRKLRDRLRIVLGESWP